MFASKKSQRGFFRKASLTKFGGDSFAGVHSSQLCLKTLKTGSRAKRREAASGVWWSQLGGDINRFLGHTSLRIIRLSPLLEHTNNSRFHWHLILQELLCIILVNMKIWSSQGRWYSRKFSNNPFSETEQGFGVGKFFKTQRKWPMAICEGWSGIDGDLTTFCFYNLC